MAHPTVWLFEDQLNQGLSVLREAPKDARILMIESRQAFRAVPYHPKRLTFLISAMRHFADELRSSGRTVHYYGLNRRPYLDSLSAIRHFIKQHKCKEFWVATPPDHHTRAWLETLPELLGISIRYFPNNLFLVDLDEFSKWAKSVKSPVMEFFYRRMRRTHNVLMEGDKPAGGKWNLDKENRKTNPDPLSIPAIPSLAPDEITRDVMRDVDRVFKDHYGSTKGFDYPVTRKQSLAAFEDFISHRLESFGDYEDAMVQGQPVLFHSNLSAAMNAGLLSPMECIRAAEKAYRDGNAPLNSVEGYIRQILGWREYVYGIYQTFMPEYRERNSRKANLPLPQFFWDGKTDMNCLRQCIGNVVNNAYSHHIQRLMIICNYATLAGLSPQAVNDWFVAMYIDSHDWVVTPNVIGMAMNADGGTMATKPYVSSAAYINRMSNYCRGCKFNPKLRVGENACPFNAMYWSFLDKHRKTLSKNPRMTMILKQLDKFSSEELEVMKRQISP